LPFFDTLEDLKDSGSMKSPAFSVEALYQYGVVLLLIKAPGKPGELIDLRRVDRYPLLVTGSKIAGDTAVRYL
jgi:hypothetical protein